MIIGEALGRLFKDLSVTLNIDGNTITRDVQYHYGDHKELQKWIATKSGQKYPLLWYVTAPYTEEPNGFKNVHSKLLIFQQTQIDWFNTKRSVKSYDQIIEPVWQSVKAKLIAEQNIQLLGDIKSKFEIVDEPSYGVETNDIRLSQNDFTRTTKKGTESITLDVVDGRIIKLHMRLKTECII